MKFENIQLWHFIDFQNAYPTCWSTKYSKTLDWWVYFLNSELRLIKLILQDYWIFHFQDCISLQGWFQMSLNRVILEVACFSCNWWDEKIEIKWITLSFFMEKWWPWVGHWFFPPWGLRSQYQAITYRSSLNKILCI